MFRIVVSCVFVLLQTVGLLYGQDTGFWTGSCFDGDETLKGLHEAANQGELVLVGDTYGVQIVDIVGEG